MQEQFKPGREMKERIKDFQTGTHQYKEGVPEWMSNTVKWKRYAGLVRRSLKLDQVYKVDEERDKVLRNVPYMPALCAAL